MPFDMLHQVDEHITTRLLPAVRSKWVPQFLFGMQAFGLRSFHSAGSNARMVVDNVNTAASKVLRLLSNQGLADYLGKIFDTLELIEPASYINVDHSDVHGLAALVGAVQTRCGRAIPCFVATTYAQCLSTDKNQPRKARMKKAMKKERETLSYTQHTKDALSEFADRLGFWPRFVFDRGFGNKAIIEHLYAHRAIFYIRLKAGRYVQYDGQITQVKDLDDADSVIELFGLTLRIIRSDRSKNNTEPWYIITNDMTATRDEIINIYYHRFEIEETFKDSKHIFDLHRARFIKPLSLKIILWFVFLTMAMFYLITQKTITNEHQRHHKKRRSWIKIAYEQYQLAITKHLKIAHNTTYPKVHVAQVLFPAHAGVIPKTTYAIKRKKTFPRTRGGDPL